jgi:hypothetical protein
MRRRINTMKHSIKGLITHVEYAAAKGLTPVEYAAALRWRKAFTKMTELSMNYSRKPKGKMPDFMQIAFKELQEAEAEVSKVAISERARDYLLWDCFSPFH